MADRSKLARIPAGLRAQLNRRLASSGYGDLVGISQWLEGKGVRVGKTAVWRYAKRLEAEATMNTALGGSTATGLSPAAMRLACLTIAQRSSGTQAAVIKRAQAYVEWVTGGATKPPAKR